MCGDEFKCIFSAFEWDNILRMFQNEVKAKRYQKMSYESWRELKELSESMDTWDQVRVYWNDLGYDRYSLLTIYIDCKANDRPNVPFEFDVGDKSFGDFLYELELYREEKEQMRVKESRYTDSEGREWQTYEPVKQHALDLKDMGKLGISKLAVLNDEADVEFHVGYHSNVNINTTKNDKENNIMKFNFDFGPVNSQVVRMSMYGLAVKNKAGTWVSYDAASGNIVDVDVFNFDGAKFLYKMPVAIKDIAAGDVVIHNGAPMFVLNVTNNKTLTVVDVISGERKDIMLATSPFGFNFATKVVNFLGDMVTGTATAENPFGNMWMLMAMSSDTKMDDMLPLALMAGGNIDMSNPMMMWAMMGNRTNDPMMLAMAMGTFNKPAHTCTCGGNCGHTQAQN
jgi:hypothetical protein